MPGASGGRPHHHRSDIRPTTAPSPMVISATAYFARPRTKPHHRGPDRDGHTWGFHVAGEAWDSRCASEGQISQRTPTDASAEPDVPGGPELIALVRRSDRRGPGQRQSVLLEQGPGSSLLCLFVIAVPFCVVRSGAENRYRLSWSLGRSRRRVSSTLVLASLPPPYPLGHFLYSS